MLELTFQEIDLVNGAGHGAVEACLAIGAVGALGGSFFTPMGSALGGLGGCGVGLFLYYAF